MGQAAHLRNYASLPEECEIVALAEPKPRQAAAVAARYAIPKTYSDHRELLARETFDAIVAPQPFTRHGLLLCELARAGVPILSEKPLAGSLATAERILAALQEHRTWLMVGYHKRNDPAVVHARRVIDSWKASGEAGKLRYIRLTMPPGDWIAGGFDDVITFPGEPAPPLDFDPPPADLGPETARKYETFVNYYIHQVNLLRYLFGEDYGVTYADPAGVLLIAHSATGIPGTIEMAPHSTTLAWQEQAFVAFEHGHITISLPAPLARHRPGAVEIYRDQPGGQPHTIRPTLPWIDAMRGQALNFLQAVRGEAPAPCLAPEAFADLRVARDYIRLLTSV